MGTGSSSRRSREVSVCLDEDVFGKINNQLPNTAVPIEIKPKRRLNGGHRRVSLRGDSVNKSSSFFSNISSNKNGSFVSFISINKSEYMRQNDKLKHELNDLKNKMSSQIQTLLSSNITLKNHNVKLTSEIDEIKSSRNKIHKELICALDNQLAMKENVQFYQHKVNELQNVITVQGKDFKQHATTSNHYAPFSIAISNHIMSTFLEFMISSSRQFNNYELNQFSNISILNKNVIIFVCQTLSESVSSEVINEMLRLFASLISNFMLCNIRLITKSIAEIKDCSADCDAIIVVDSVDCACTSGIELMTGKPVHHLKYFTKKRSCPPIEEISSLLIKYNIFERTLSVDVQLFVLNLWECDVYSLSPLVFDYASFFMYCKQGVIAHRLALINSLIKNRSFSELDFYVQHIKKSLFVSCSKADANAFMAHLQDSFRGELTVFCEVEGSDTYDELSQMILASLFYQVGLDSKFVGISDQSVFDVIDYLSLYFKVVIFISIRSNAINRCLERFLLLQKRSQSLCIIFGSAVFVQIIQLCDSVYLSESHTPALKLKSKMRTLKSIISSLDSELVDHANTFTHLLTIFISGISDSCLLSMLNMPATTYFTLKRTLISMNVVCDETGLVKLMPEICPQEGNLMLKKLSTVSLQHITQCRCYHLHLKDLPNLLELSRSLEVAHAIISNPEALAFHLYHNSSSTLMQSFKNSVQFDNTNLAKEFLSLYSNFPPTERVLIFRIISQLFYTEKAPYECRFFGKMAEDLEVYLDCDPCFASYGVRAKLSTQKLKLCKTELLLHETYCYAMRNKQMNEAVQILLLHSGILKSLDSNSSSKKCFDRACSIFQHHTELIEIEQVFSYCTLLNIIKRPDIVDFVFQNLVSKLGSKTSHHIVCMVLMSYASFHISNGKLNCAVPLLEYLRNAPQILVEPYRTKTLRMLALAYLKLDNAPEAIDVYRIILGKEVKFSSLSEKTLFEDVYNYILALIRRRFFGSAYDIVKSLSENMPEKVSSDHHRVKVLKLLMYLRSVISKCKPNSGHYRAAVFL